MARRRVVVVGAGIAGLATAYRLTRTHNGDDPSDVIVVEQGDRAGGKLWTTQLDGMPVEAGADSFVVRKPWAVELCKELGMGDELVTPGAEGASVWVRGRLVPFPTRSAFGIPSTARSLLRWPGLSVRGRFRAAADLYRRATKGDGDQSLGSLIRWRMGPEALRVLVGPLLGGIHAGDPDRLSLLATFPELRSWERGHESLIRGARASLKAVGATQRSPLFATVWGGLTGLVSALESAVGVDRIWLGTPVTGIRRGDRGEWQIAAGGKPLEASAIVLATPAFATAELLAEASPAAAARLRAIPYVSTAVVFLMYPYGALPTGTGFVLPLGERPITACTYLSQKWPREETRERVILRCFVGRAGQEDTLDQSDEDLISRVSKEVEEALRLSGPPVASRVVRWPRSMAQYEVGHLDRVSQIEEALQGTPGLFVTGSAYRGVGIADCVRHANETAAGVVAYLRVARTGSSTERNDETRESISWKK